MLDVLIIGGGPHALTLATLLSNPEPDQPPPQVAGLSMGLQASRNTVWSNRFRRKSKRRGPPTNEHYNNGQTTEWNVPSETSQKVPCPPLNFKVVDSYGEWAALWESQFSALNIPHLRSHTLVHTDPFNKTALQEFVVQSGRTAELHSLPDQVYILDDNAFFNDMRLGKKQKRRLSIAVSLKRSMPFSLPGTGLSVDFFKQQVDRYGLEEVIVKGTVASITPVMEGEDRGKKDWEDERMTLKMEEGDKAEGLGEGERLKRRVKFFRVLLQGGDTIEARRVVMATGPTRAQMANTPSWVGSIGESYPEERLQHTVQLMHHLPVARQLEKEAEMQEMEDGSSSTGEKLQTSTVTSHYPMFLDNCFSLRFYLRYAVCEEGQRVMVYGGGLTSAHLVSMALQQGACHVVWVMRKHLQLKQFDVGDVESLVGRYSHTEHGIKLDGRAYLTQFYNERSLHRRLAMIKQARKGGAVTPEAYAHLQPYIKSGQVDVKTYCQVSEAMWCYRSQSWNLSLSNGDSWTGDHIWLATGCKLDVNQDPLLSEVTEKFPIQVIDGWPCITENLKWAPECPLYLMGQYTALQVGPHAVNLAGGQAASFRIAKDILCELRGSEAAEMGTAERTRTKEYIEQMHGLMWL
ncbi:uncharacterized protein FYW47_002653 [Aplochiton taeniatus]